MIVTHIMGGLGNQLFQYALGRALAHRHNAELKLDITDTEASKFSHHNYYRLGEFNVQENFATAEEFKNLPRIVEKNSSQPNFQPEILDAPDNIWLHGYWQSEKYFSDIADILRRELTLKNPLGEISSSWLKKILDAECAVSLHVRHGDYLTPLIRNNSGILPLDYYKTCVDELKKDFPNLILFVFSDDLTWAKENLNFGVPIEFVEGCERDAEEMYLMSRCQHNIISHSTFSWWGAWLNPNPDKKVFAPYPWSRSSNGFHDIFPESWIKIPVDYEKSARENFPPFLSLIVYVENNADTISFALSSVVSQNFKDYEIIVVDTSTDSSGEFCRRFAGNFKVTFLQANPSTGKFTSWNLGVECSRGEYVLFLTAKDFLISNAAEMLAQFMYNYLKGIVEVKNETYIGSKNYGEVFPNIVCATQRLAEDDAGTLTISGLPDRKFTLTVDAPFQNLKAITELEIASAQKLILLGTNQLNNLIGTKFFRRDFLNENKIRFDENLSADAELKFLVDAFLGTEKITFMPQVFYGRLN